MQVWCGRGEKRGGRSEGGGGSGDSMTINKALEDLSLAGCISGAHGGKHGVGGVGYNTIHFF